MSNDRPKAPQHSTVEPGELVAGKYRVERVLAVGGMGVIMAAKHEELDQQVALKILRQDSMKSEEAVTRFLREARTSARLQSEHVARVFDVGTIEGVPFMVMERLSGLDLQQVVDSRGALPIQDTVDYVLQTLEAVAEAHSLGIVHRDIKPSNLFLASRPDGTDRIKVLDFGISKEGGIDAPMSDALTATKQVIGSPGYMSPEQMLSPKSVDGRTDIWAIGVLLFELLSGKSPFLGETVAAVMTNILHRPLPKLRDARADVPEGLERVVMMCLERDSEARCPNVAELARALEPFGSSWAKLSVQRIESALGSSKPPPTPSVQPAVATSVPSPHMQTASTWAGTARKEGAKRRLWMVLAISGLTTAIITAAFLLSRRPSEPAAARDPSATSAAAGASDATTTVAPGGSEVAVAPASAKPVETPAPSGPEVAASSSSGAATATAVASASSAAAAPKIRTAAATGAKTAAGGRTKKTKKVVDVLGDRQ